jgi:hypothetical protein
VGALAPAVVLVALLMACGGGSSLASPPPCPSPTAAPTPARGARGLDLQYSRTVNDGTKQLAQLLADFRAAYPDGKFYRENAFRDRFVTYEGNAGCVAANLKALAPVPVRFTEFDKALKAIMADYQAALSAGHDAVAHRNVSDYRDWDHSMDDLATRIAEAIKTISN